MNQRPRGRPPKGQRAMTNAERQRAYRQRIADASISLLNTISANNENTASWSETIEEINDLASARVRIEMVEDPCWLSDPSMQMTMILAGADLSTRCVIDDPAGCPMCGKTQQEHLQALYRPEIWD